MRTKFSGVYKLVSKKWYVIVSLLTILIYFRAAPLQVDPHHDGVILAAAVAVADGHEILSGAFSQYGPLPSLIQGFVLWIFNTQLLTLRYLTAVQCLVIGYLLYRLSREFTTLLLSRLVAFTWLLTSCIWVTEFPGSLLPWPSILSTLLVLLAILSIIKAERKLNPYLAFISGLFFGLAGFCRIQAFILLPLVIVIWLIKFRPRRTLIALSTSGYVTSIILVFTYLTLTDGLDDFIQQVIVTPIFTYSGIGQANNYNRFQFALYLIEVIGFIILLFFTKFITSRTNSKIIGICLLTSVIFGISSIGVWIGNTSIPIRLKVLIGEPAQNLVISPYYFAAISSLYLFTILLFQAKSNSNKISFPEGIVIVCAFGTVPQLYPQADVMHLWWIAPIFLPSLILLLNSYQRKSNREDSVVLNTILASCIIIGSFSALQFIDRPWSEYKLSVLKDTYAHEEKARSVDIFKEIESVAIRGATSFDCPDGIYSVAHGSYLPPDQWFVNWGFDASTKPKVGTVRIICDQSQKYAISESIRLEMNLLSYKSNESNKSIAVLKKRE